MDKQSVKAAVGAAACDQLERGGTLDMRNMLEDRGWGCWCCNADCKCCLHSHKRLAFGYGAPRAACASEVHHACVTFAAWQRDLNTTSWA